MGDGNYSEGGAAVSASSNPPGPAAIMQGATQPEHRKVVGSPTNAEAKKESCCTPAKAQAFVLRNFLMLGFGVALLWGLAWPEPGAEVSSWTWNGWKIVQTLNIVIIFIISGLTLKSSDVKKALSRDGRRSFIFGIVSILFVTPLAGFLVVNVPFKVDEFAYGLALFAVVPTTLASGVTLVMTANGNDALALLLTVVTNVLGIPIVPFMLKGVFNGVSTSVDAVQLLVKLVITVLIPLAIGKAISKGVKGCPAWCKKHKTALQLTSSMNLIIAVWQNISAAAGDIIALKAVSILSVVAGGIILHLIFLAFNYPVANYLLKLEVREMRCVTIMGSQKTLPMALTVVQYLGDLGSIGLMTVACIVAHLSQIFIDSMIVSRWAGKDIAAAKAAAAAEATAASDNDGEGENDGEREREREEHRSSLLLRKSAEARQSNDASVDEEYKQRESGRDEGDVDIEKGGSAAKQQGT